MKNRDMSSIKGREVVLKNRSLQINSLRKSSMELWADRVEECKRTILESYEQSTISQKIANIIREKHMEDHRFRSIGFHHSIKLSEFNNRSYYWGPYFSDIGRIIAQNERQYVHRRIGRFVRGEKEKISRSRPDFSILNTTVKELSDINLQPNIILAPVEMLPGFTLHYRDNLDWSKTGEQLFIENCRLSVIWSHRFAQLRSFLIFNSKASTWYALPDDEDNERTITIAFGKPERHSEMLEYWVEVIAYYKITTPMAFKRVNLSP